MILHPRHLQQAWNRVRPIWKDQFGLPDIWLPSVEAWTASSIIVCNRSTRLRLEPPFKARAAEGACVGAQAEFSEHHEAEVGNEAIVKGLVEMRKYWDALEGDFHVEETGAEGFEDEKKGRTHHLPNHGVCLLT